MLHLLRHRNPSYPRALLPLYDVCELLQVSDGLKYASKEVSHLQD